MPEKRLASHLWRDEPGDCRKSLQNLDLQENLRAVEKSSRWKDISFPLYLYLFQLFIIY